MTLLVSNRSYRFLFSATAVSNLGDGVSALAFPWLATLITRDPVLIAMVTAAVRLPWLLFSIPAGVLVDRRDRRRLMIQADSFRLLLTLGAIALILTIPDFPPGGSGAPHMLALSGLAFLLGAAEVVRDNAAQTVLPSIVEPRDLESANGQMWSVEQVMGSFVGPPLAGILIALAVPAPFALDAVTFGIAAWFVWCISMPPRAPAVGRRIGHEIAEGWAWLRGATTLLRLAVMLGLMNAIATMAATVLVLMAQEVLGLDAAGYGLLLTAGAAGGVTGGLLGPRLVARLGGERSLWLALMLMPLPFLALALTASPIVAGAALFLEMVAALVWNIVTVSYRQRTIPDVLLGRVNALYRFFGWGMMPLGALAGGGVVALAEPDLGREMALRLPYLLAAAGAVAMAVYGRARLRLR